ncbi:50S ribosomal protein L4 [Candidatus Parcubacteria bacterium]|nr:50S ribosomal protein L4 [Candidatus Parcubacteria bacterium]
MEAKIYNQEAKEAGKVVLPESIFGLNWNADLVHQAMVSSMSNKRANTADSKDRSEVSGGGKKPWKQKGTGRARHGSRRSPIWVGGGVTHGPTNERNYKKKINKKMKAKALFTVLSEKMRNGELIFIDKLNLSEMKTKNALGIMSAFAKELKNQRIEDGRKPYIHLAIDENDVNVVKSFNNLPQVDTDEMRNLNLLQLLNHKYVFIVNPEKTLEFLGEKLN